MSTPRWTLCSRFLVTLVCIQEENETREEERSIKNRNDPNALNDESCAMNMSIFLWDLSICSCLSRLSIESAIC